MLLFPPPQVLIASRAAAGFPPALALRALERAIAHRAPSSAALPLGAMADRQQILRDLLAATTEEMQAAQQVAVAYTHIARLQTQRVQQLQELLAFSPTPGPSQLLPQGPALPVALPMPMMPPLTALPVPPLPEASLVPSPVGRPQQALPEAPPCPTLPPPLPAARPPQFLHQGGPAPSSPKDRGGAAGSSHSASQGPPPADIPATARPRRSPSSSASEDVTASTLGRSRTRSRRCSGRPAAVDAAAADTAVDAATGAAADAPEAAADAPEAAAEAPEAAAGDPPSPSDRARAKDVVGEVRHGRSVRRCEGGWARMQDLAAAFGWTHAQADTAVRLAAERVETRIYSNAPWVRATPWTGREGETRYAAEVDPTARRARRRRSRRQTG